MRLYSYSTDELDVVVYKWAIKEDGFTFYTVKEVVKDGFGSDLVQREYDFQTLEEARNRFDSLTKDSLSC